jgi:hypothetical protein
MTSFSINAILGTHTYEDNDEAFGTENLKSERYPLQKIKARKLTDTDEDEGL